MKICILSGFSGFTKLSAEVISRNIQKSSGQVLLHSSPDFDPSSLTCMIVPETAQLSKILEILNQPSLPSCPLVVPNWAIDSFKQKNLQPLDNYLYLNKQLPIKRAVPATNPPDPSKKPSKLLSDHSNSSSPRADSTDHQLNSFNSLKLNLKPESNQEFYFSNHQTLKEDFLNHKEKYAFSHNTGPNLNEHITSVLEVLMENYFLLKDKARAFAYRFAIAALKSHPEKIICEEQAEKLQKVGKAIRKKIGEILETGSLKRVKAMEDMERLKAMKVLSTVWGIGAATASKLFSLGYRTIEDLKKNVPECLNENQRVCLELYEEIEMKIPRDEVKVISEIVVNQARELMTGVEITANTCGSYRRGKEFCGDIDVLLTFENILEHKTFLAELVEALHGKGLITHTLVLSFDVKKHENFTFSGIAKLENGIHRRLDIKIYPKKSYAWALMHFTGSATFNRSIRLFAKNKGLKLTDEGLFPAFRNGSETVCGGSLIECLTEEDIFKLFDMEYKPPEERDL